MLLKNVQSFFCVCLIFFFRLKFLTSVMHSRYDYDTTNNRRWWKKNMMRWNTERDSRLQHSVIMTKDVVVHWHHLNLRVTFNLYASSPHSLSRSLHCFFHALIFPLFVPSHARHIKWIRFSRDFICVAVMHSVVCRSDDNNCHLENIFRAISCRFFCAAVVSYANHWTTASRRKINIEFDFLFAQHFVFLYTQTQTRTQ